MVINYFPVYMKQLCTFMMTHFLSFQAWLLRVEILLMFGYWQHAKGQVCLQWIFMQKQIPY